MTSSKEPKKIEIQAGYIVGCQVNFGGGTMGGGAGLGLSDGALTRVTWVSVVAVR